MVKLENATEARIVGVAERVFLQSGFSRVSMDDLAKELGMSKKTLYAYFAGKDALVQAILEHRTTKIEKSLQEIVECAKPFVEKFRDLAQLLQIRIGEVSPAFLEDIRRFFSGGLWRDRAVSGPVPFRGISGASSMTASRRAIWRTPCRGNCLMRMVVLSIQGIVRPDVVAELKLHPSAALDHVLTIIFSGILTPKGRKARKQFHIMKKVFPIIIVVAIVAAIVIFTRRAGSSPSTKAASIPAMVRRAGLYLIADRRGSPNSDGQTRRPGREGCSAFELEREEEKAARSEAEETLRESNAPGQGQAGLRPRQKPAGQNA